jgi:hypothetical protein
MRPLAGIFLVPLKQINPTGSPAGNSNSRQVLPPLETSQEIGFVSFANGSVALSNERQFELPLDDNLSKYPKIILGSTR